MKNKKSLTLFLFLSFSRQEEAAGADHSQRGRRLIN
jgi:hypothetical protein